MSERTRDTRLRTVRWLAWLAGSARHVIAAALGLLLTASATSQPAIAHTPPDQVSSPEDLDRRRPTEPGWTPGTLTLRFLPDFHRHFEGAIPPRASSPATESSFGLVRIAHSLQELDPDLVGTGFYERRRGDRGGFFATAEEIDIPIREGRNVWEMLNTFRGAIARIGLNRINRFGLTRRSTCFSVWINGRPGRFHSEPPRTMYAEEIAGLEVLRPGEIPFDEFYDTNEVTRCHILGIWLKGRAS